jgi:hypothetical protein
LKNVFWGFRKLFKIIENLAGGKKLKLT